MSPRGRQCRLKLSAFPMLRSRRISDPRSGPPMPDALPTMIQSFQCASTRTSGSKECGSIQGPLAWASEMLGLPFFPLCFRHQNFSFCKESFIIHDSTLSSHQCTTNHSTKSTTRAGALVTSTTLPGWRATRMGPGQYPQYTRAPKVGGGCGWLASTTTTWPMCTTVTPKSTHGSGARHTIHNVAVQGPRSTTTWSRRAPD